MAAGRVLALLVLAAAAGPTAMAQPGPEPTSAPTQTGPMLLDRMPPAVYEALAASRSRQVAIRDLRWRTPTVRVAFNGGSEALYALIEATAQEWTQGGRLQLSFKDASGRYRKWSENDTRPSADIRIGFFTDPDRDGYWSSVGVMARDLRADEATMNYGGFVALLGPNYPRPDSPTWRASYSRSAVLHEFGHALGLAHEHFHPKCQADLKLDEAIASLVRSQGWSSVTAQYNLDAAFYFREMARRTTAPASYTPATDRSSVMMYSFPDSFYRSASQSPCKPASPGGHATALSPGDRQFYLANYSRIP